MVLINAVISMGRHNALIGEFGKSKVSLDSGRPNRRSPT